MKESLLHAYYDGKGTLPSRTKKFLVIPVITLLLIGMAAVACVQ